MAYLVLIHGTFARNAAWTKPDSIFRKYIVDNIEDQSSSHTFHLVRWSGRNRGRERWIASQSIATEVIRLHERDPLQPIFLIGHSHGGSAMAYFIRQHPYIASKVHGFVFLSTPFIGIRLHENYQKIISSLVAALSIALLFAFAICNAVLQDYIRGPGLTLLGEYASVFQSSLANLFFDHPITGWAFALLPGFIPIVLSYKIAIFANKYLIKYASEVLVERFERRDTTRISCENALFMRMTGDEAASFLSATQFGSYALNRFLSAAGILLWPVRTISNAMTRTGFILKSLAKITVFAFSIWISFSGTLWLIQLRNCRYVTQNQIFRDECRFTNILNTISENWGISNDPINQWYWDDYIIAGFGSLWPFFLIITITSVVYLFIFVTVTGTLVITLIAFGWVRLSEAIFADLSVETLPIGNQQLHHIPWPSDTLRKDLGLNHSRIYAEEKALNILTSWISNKIK